MLLRYCALLSLVVLSLGATRVSFNQEAPKPGKDYAFLFHNANFSQGWTALPDTETEISKLATELATNYNFEVKRYANLNLATLRATLAEINRRPFGSNDQVLFYFSSHGYYQASSDRGYLIPTDGPANWNFGQGWLSYDELREYLSANTAKHVLVGLDACHSGSFGKRTKGGPTTLPWKRDADCETISRSSLQRKSRLYFSSGNKNQRTAAQSEFLSRWLQCLREKSNRRQYVVSSQDLRGYVNTVSSSTPENGTFVGHDESGEFVFIHKDACALREDPLLAADNAHWVGVQRDKTAIKANEHISLYKNCAHYKEALKILSDGTATSETNRTIIPNGMVNVPGGSYMKKFVAGSSKVYISPFQIGKYEVTFTEYDLYTATTGKTELKSSFGRGQNPAIYVTWFDAISYCNWRSKREGFIPFYQLKDVRRQADWEKSEYGIELTEKDEVLANWDTDGFRLPTEAEWQYVASYVDGRRLSKYGNGKDALIQSESNFTILESEIDTEVKLNNRRKTVEVGSLNSPNNLGVHDMSGNVWEWCWDFRSYSTEKLKETRNPRGPLTGQKRVRSGGGWNFSHQTCTSSTHNGVSMKSEYVDTGFRLARTPTGNVSMHK